MEKRYIPNLILHFLKAESQPIVACSRFEKPTDKEAQLHTTPLADILASGQIMEIYLPLVDNKMAEGLLV